MDPSSTGSASSLVARGAELRASIAEGKKTLEEIERALLELPAGAYRTSAGQSAARVTVVSPGPSIKPTPEAVAQVRELLDDDRVFRALFERVISHKPVKGFRDVLNALCTTAKIRKVEALCETPGAKYLRWS